MSIATERITRGVPSRYRLHALALAKPTEGGLLFQREDGAFVLPWQRIERAFAATIGTGSDARVGFRLALRRGGDDCQIVQLDLEQPADAGQYARAMMLGLGPDSCDASLKTLAAEGIAPRTFVEAEVFDDAVLESMRWAASEAGAGA